MKKNLLSIIILALLLVNIGLTVVMMISITGTNGKTAMLVDSIATNLNIASNGPGEATVEEVISLADTEVYEIASALTIPLKVEEGGKQVYAVCNISLQINKNHPDYATLNPIVASSESLIKDAIRTVIASKTEDEARNNQEALKAEILDAIQKLFGSDFIYNVNIPEIKFG